MIKKVLEFKIKIFCVLIGWFLAFQDLSFAFSEDYSALRAPLSFNQPKSINKIQSNIVEQLKKHLYVILRITKDGTVMGWAPLPMVTFLQGKRLKYEYDVEKNEIIFSMPKRVTGKDFEKICWLAYGRWLSYNHENDYDEDAGEYSQRMWKDKQHLKIMDKHIKIRLVKNKNVLDIASGPGIPGILIAEKGAKKVVCLDVSEAMIKEGIVEAEKRGLKNIEFQKGSAFELPYEDNSFDVIFANRFFKEIPAELRDIALKEIIRVLKPGGKFLLYVEHMPDRSNDFSLPEQMTRGAIGWNYKEWLEKLIEAGFENGTIVDRHVFIKIIQEDIPKGWSYWHIPYDMYFMEANKPVLVNGGGGVNTRRRTKSSL
jgi:ubiquinone/menaquinone biosynthesis C-methylase UbiE